ncbi:hypothetical protein DFP94_102183 [Fontibacillus phaseoli]|uniref:Uncharacterized protein n=1 Tax=Fontibacillus phaseoli TaxID=1416533 RepID=A0A369BIL5_9BACL|nr:hypothetical protein [Fontibacillus phaseoli]RCX21430.1 hypothetical protein DFP94_102183 [Fontibacillus phaseoli]
MEKLIVKTGVYSFLIALLIGVVFFKDTTVVKYDGSAVTELIQLPLRQYLFKLLRFSSLLSLVAMAIAWISRYFVITKEKTRFGVLLKSYIIAFLLVLLIIFSVACILFLLNRP